jgi:tryptophan synthase alpha chain
MNRSASIATALKRVEQSAPPALVAYVTAGFPDRAGFRSLLREVAAVADLIEVGVPFTDPMADGATIQRSSRVALEQGVTLPWILEEIEAAAVTTPLLLMSYLNPLLAFGSERLGTACARAGAYGLIIPDLPYEESFELRDVLAAAHCGLVQFVTPVTPEERLQLVCPASQGFVYAVTMTGTTGRDAAVPAQVLSYLDRVRQVATVPVCAGFGIRSAAQVQQLTGHVDGVIVGSALIETLERREDPADFLESLRV